LLERSALRGLYHSGILLVGAAGPSARIASKPGGPLAHVGRLESEETAMPGHFCHMEAPHKKLRLPEWYVSSLMMDRALDAVVRRVKNLDRDHDIPYLAGYSRDGKTIYIDRHMPPSFRYRGRDIDTDRFLILHEEVEKTLIDQLELHYLHAHQIATRAEQAAALARTDFLNHTIGNPRRPNPVHDQPDDADAPARRMPLRLDGEETITRKQRRRDFDPAAV